MRTLAFDGRMGASGDMILGALLAVGADRSVLEPVEAALDVEYRIERITDHGIAATRVQVLRDGVALEGGGPSRSFADVRARVESIDLPADVETDAIETFRLLAEAEARVHSVDVADTHFHEVGADDAIADVVGAVLLLADLGMDRVLTGPLATGGGEVAMEHGRYPVPAPAVVELAREAPWSIRGGPVESELLTPTGAAILARMAEGVETLPPLSVSATGYGAGRREFPDRANVLRATVGAAVFSRDDITVLETNLDDVTPEVLGGLQETLIEAGARDVTIIPATMKKSRPGHLVQVIAKPDDAGRIVRRLAAETGTLGVRETGVSHRWIADRGVETVTVDVAGDRFEVDVKVGRDDGGDVYDVSAEYDDAAAVARATGRSIRDVMRLAEREWLGE